MGFPLLLNSFRYPFVCYVLFSGLLTHHGRRSVAFSCSLYFLLVLKVSPYHDRLQLMYLLSAPCIEYAYYSNIIAKYSRIEDYLSFSVYELLLIILQVSCKVRYLLVV